MSANTVANSDSIVRSELWQAQLEEILHEDLLAVPFVRTLDFPDGSTFTIPSLGTPLVRDLPVGAEVTFDALDVGEVTISLSQPIVSANSIHETLLEDSMWASEMMSAIPVEQARAIMEFYETDVLSLAMDQGQGVNDANLINGVAHRRIASGTSEVMDVKDFSLAGYSLRKAKVPRQNLIAIVDPSVGYAMETQTNITNISNNPMWQGIVETGITNNHKFVRNIYGFDVYESEFLPTMNETIGGRTTTAGVANIFMSLARPTLLPFGVAWRRPAKMTVEMDNKLHELQVQTSARWGKGLIRQDNLVVIGSDTDQVS